MIIVSGVAQLGEGEMDRLQAAMAKQMLATQAEDGCEQYIFSHNIAKPDMLIISERWRDQAALDAHFATPHMAEFNAVIGAAKVLSLKVVAYDVTGERILLGG